MKNTTKTIENLKLLTINTRGIKSKCMSLTTALHQPGTHIAAITETQLTSNENINIQGYKWIGKNRETGKGGGVGFLIRNDIDNIVSEIKGTSVTHVGCECGSISHVSQNKTQFMYNVYYKLNDVIHTNNVQLFTHSSMRENYIITILDLYPLTFRLHTWHINPLVCKALNT